MCSKALEKPKKPCKGIKISEKLDIIKDICYHLVDYFLCLGMLKNFSKQISGNSFPLYYLGLENVK